MAATRDATASTSIGPTCRRVLLAALDPAAVTHAAAPSNGPVATSSHSQTRVDCATHASLDAERRRAATCGADVERCRPHLTSDVSAAAPPPFDSRRKNPPGPVDPLRCSPDPVSGRPDRNRASCRRPAVQPAPLIPPRDRTSRHSSSPTSTSSSRPASALRQTPTESSMRRSGTTIDDLRTVTRWRRTVESRSPSCRWAPGRD
jgi:hypothetical protein